MAEYRLRLPINYGTILINGVAPLDFYEEATSLSLAITLEPGLFIANWILNSSVIGSTNPIVFNMPSRDSKINLTTTGNIAPPNDYGLRFFSDKCDLEGVAIRLEIYKFNYVGISEEVTALEVSQNFGENSQSPESVLKTIVRGSLDFELAGTAGLFDEFLTGGNREWRVVLKKATVIRFQGYMTVDYIDSPDQSGNVIQSFTAIDGLQQLDAIRALPERFPGVFGVSGISHQALTGVLNQTFKERRNTNIICSVLEDRMIGTLSLFEQFYTPYASIFTDGKISSYTNENNIFNLYLPSSEVIENLLNPFLCRVFIWENEFWIVRIPDLNSASATGRVFDGNGDFVEAVTVTNDQNLLCDFNLPSKRSGRAYTEFTATLKLGILSTAAAGAIFEYKFDLDSFRLASPASPYPGAWILRDWDYVNSFPGNQPTSTPSGDLARVQYVSDSTGDSVQIWTTTTTAGLSDPNLSSISLSTTDTGQVYLIADEIANKLSIEFEFSIFPVSSSPTNSIGSHKVAFQVKVGSNYLYEISPDVYGFSLTVNTIQIPLTNISLYAWNSVKITNVTIPETAVVEVNLYQLILNTGTRHQSTVRYRNFKLSIEENEALTLNEIGIKAKTVAEYSSVLPEYITKIGDAETNMSSSGILLLPPNIQEVSKLWTSSTTTSEPLLGVIAQDLADLFGRPYRFLRGEVNRVDIKPYQSVIYDGKYWLITNFVWDAFKNSYQFVAFELGDI